MGYSPRGHKESDTTEQWSTREGNTLEEEKSRNSEADYCLTCVSDAPAYTMPCGPT